jgi:hypothetical protein
MNVSKEAFIQIITGQNVEEAKSAQSGATELPDEAFSFDDEIITEEVPQVLNGFAVSLFEKCFGNAQNIPREQIILGEDPSFRYLPQRVYYWNKITSRPFHVLLMELEIDGSHLLNEKLFKAKLAKFDDLQSALTRFVQMALKGFEKGGGERTTDAKKGKQQETLCIVSVSDHRQDKKNPSNLLCCGTVVPDPKNDNDNLEVFFIDGASRYWDQALCEDHLGAIYKKHYTRLSGSNWQDAFITGTEWKMAGKLLEICIDPKADEQVLTDQVLELMDEIAKNFGIRKSPGQPRRLQSYSLPQDHDIGIDSENKRKYGNVNPFKGISIRDEKNRLLGYIVYCLKNGKDAEYLRKHLRDYNRFHNVLVIFPENNQAKLELWQGTEKLEGKLTKQGRSFAGAGEVVSLLSRFFVVSKAKTKDPKALAEELAFRARYLRKLALKQLNEEKTEGELRELFKSFKAALIHDMTEDQFADAYSQTLTYGLLAARWIMSEEAKQENTRLRDSFTRQEAIKHLPSTSSFLKQFFMDALGKTDAQSKVNWLLEDIADLLNRISIEDIFSSSDDPLDLISDPVIHFYEPFLAAYDNEIRQTRGVYYTPKPIVGFIVRSVDEILKRDFGLVDGLADITAWKDLHSKHPEIDIPEGVEGQPFVQVLDPATGTGTFLIEVIDRIYRNLIDKWEKEGKSKKQINQLWNEYVPINLLPRLFGFELMMAPYTISHLKLGLKLAETGYRIGQKINANIFLTNTLEDPQSAGVQLDAETVMAKEAKAARRVKNKSPITVIVGNPPYSVSSKNVNSWITNLLKDYKSGLEEKKINLDDDYIKFLRLSHFTVQNTNTGIIGLITNHSYLDGPTHRIIREKLLSSFNKIFIHDLHGNTYKKEKTPSGDVDQNVFDIKQGVAISIYVKKNSRTEEPTCVYFGESFGLREEKYIKLETMDIEESNWDQIYPKADSYYYVPKDFKNEDIYKSGEKITSIFPVYSTGIETQKDAIAFQFTLDEMKIIINDFIKLNEMDLREKYSIYKEKGDWKVKNAISDIKKNKEKIYPVLYRPFDIRQTVYSGVKGFHARPRSNVMGHMLDKNYAILTSRMTKGEEFAHAFITDKISEKIFLSSKTSNNSFHFPLFILGDKSGQLSFEDINISKHANIDDNYISKLKKQLSKSFSFDQSDKNHFSALEVLDYVYAILNSPNFRIRYMEFLKVDFPRIPFPKTNNVFEELSKIGSRLRKLHLMEEKLKELKTITFSGGKSSKKVTKADFQEESTESGNVWINDNEYFGNIPLISWSFFIGGYQPAQKWLKSRKGRILESVDIEHYKKIILVMKKTNQMMSEIDDIILKHGDWQGAFLSK